MKLFIYIYHGIMVVLNSFLGFCRYFYLGLKWFPSILAGMANDVAGSKKSKVKANKTTEETLINNELNVQVSQETQNENMFGDFNSNDFEVSKDADALLVQAKQEELERQQREEELRQKMFSQNEKQLNQIMNDNTLLLDKEEVKKPAKVKNNKRMEAKIAAMPEVVIDFKGEDAVRTPKKVTYQYLIKTPDGEIVRDYFAAYSRAEVYSFLKSDGNIVYEIKTSKMIDFVHGARFNSVDKFKTKDLIFFVAQLSTYLKAGISLADSIKILVKQFNNRKYKKILKLVSYDLSIGFSFSEALAKQEGVFPTILINMIKTAEMTGQLPETLDDMEEYFTEIESTRKAMITAMTYPAIIFVIAIGVGTFIMLYVVPKFIDIYNSMENAKIPWITTAVLGFSNFLQDYILYISVVVLILILLFIYLYRNVKAFRRNVQFLLMHLPVFGNVIIYNEVTTFTKTFASLLSHNVFITDSMEILNKVTNNEIYKELIYDAIANVSRGRTVSKAFEGQWAFPIPAYEMIVTGEKTGQLPEMMEKVSVYYQDLHKNSVTRIKTFIEPILIVLLTLMVGIIVLSIVIPMFSMYSQIQT